MRLFIAIELPDDVKRLLSSMRCNVPSAHWLSFEQLHLTLSFLGEVDNATMQQLTGELAAIQAPVFEFRFSGTGCFPNRKRPRVIWVGLEPEPLLDNLASAVRNTVLLCGIPQEDRTFSAHITLARLKFPASREVAAFLDQPQKQVLPTVTVREFVLFQSSLTPQGAIHTPLKSFYLHSTK